MFNAKTLATIKTIDVYDAFNDRVYVFSHSAPNATVIKASDGSIAGTIDLGGAPEQAATDGKGHLYVDIEDKDNIAVINARTMKVTDHYDIANKGGGCAGLALDVKNQILFASCRSPQNMVILSAKNGEIITTLPIGRGSDGAGFNPKTWRHSAHRATARLRSSRRATPQASPSNRLCRPCRARKPWLWTQRRTASC
jgi:DNA-binding beta-propeller fold protein YncE